MPEYQNAEKFRYGDDTTYQKGITFLDGHGLIEDWGCGFGDAGSFVTQSPYRGIDGSSPHADEIVDLREYRSQADCIFMRDVLEHNADWSRILANAVAWFKKRMALIIFTPPRPLAYRDIHNGDGISDAVISFSEERI